MKRPTRFCRVAWIVEDMDRTTQQLKDLFGLGMRFGPIAPDIIRAGIEEHGLEPIQLFRPAAELPFMNGAPYPLLDISLAVHDCEETYRVLAADGVLPSFTSPLPGPDTQEHLYAQGVGGLPILICTDGDNESMMAPFKNLEEAAPPKLGVMSMGVASIDRVAPLYKKYFDMDWVEADPGGLGRRAVVGPHRIKLVEMPDPALSKHYMQTLLAAEMMFDEPHTARENLERAGYSVLRERTFKSGRKAWYFGAVISGLPLTVYDSRDDREARGLD